MYVHTYMRACMRVCMHAYVHAWTHACMHAYIHKLYTHAHAHACMHTYSPVPLSLSVPPPMAKETQEEQNEHSKNNAEGTPKSPLHEVPPSDNQQPDPISPGRERHDGVADQSDGEVTRESPGTLVMGVSPEKALSDALAKQREVERDSFHQLTRENATIEQEKKQLSESVQDLLTKVELLNLDLETERQSKAALEKDLGEMKAELKAVLLAAKKAKARVKSATDEKDQAEIEHQKAKYERKLEHLHCRLKKLAEDEEEKDKKMSEMRCQIEEKDRIINGLDDDEVNRVGDDTSVVCKSGRPLTNVVLPPPVGGRNPRSAICVVQ